MWRSSFSSCDGPSTTSDLCQLAAGPANFENRQRRADTQLMFAETPHAAQPAALAGEGGPAASPAEGQRQRLVGELAQLNEQVRAALSQHFAAQPEQLRTLLAVNEELARTDTAMRSSGTYGPGRGDMGHSFAAEAPDGTEDEVQEAERRRWLADLERGLADAPHLRAGVLRLAEERRRLGRQLERLLTRSEWLM